MEGAQGRANFFSFFFSFPLFLAQAHISREVCFPRNFEKALCEGFMDVYGFMCVILYLRLCVYKFFVVVIP